MTSKDQLEKDYLEFLTAEHKHLMRNDIPPEESGLEHATICGVLMSLGIPLWNPQHHTAFAESLRIHPAALCRIILGRVRVTTGIAERFATATGQPVELWLRLRATRDEPLPEPFQLPAPAEPVVASQ